MSTHPEPATAHQHGEPPEPQTVDHAKYREWAEEAIEGGYTSVNVEPAVLLALLEASRTATAAARAEVARQVRGLSVWFGATHEYATGYNDGVQATRAAVLALLDAAPRQPTDERECLCEGEFIWACGPECECWHHSDWSNVVVDEGDEAP